MESKYSPGDYEAGIPPHTQYCASTDEAACAEGLLRDCQNSCWSDSSCTYASADACWAQGDCSGVPCDPDVYYQFWAPDVDVVGCIYFGAIKESGSWVNRDGTDLNVSITEDSAGDEYCSCYYPPNGFFYDAPCANNWQGGDVPFVCYFDGASCAPHEYHWHWDDYHDGREYAYEFCESTGMCQIARSPATASNRGRPFQPGRPPSTTRSTSPRSGPARRRVSRIRPAFGRCSA